MAQGISGKDQSPLLGNGSQQNPVVAFSDINIPLTVTGPSQEFNLGFFGPHDGGTIKYGCSVSLGEAPAAGKNFVTCEKGSKPNTVLIKVWKNTFAAADASTVTKVNLVAVRGSAVAQ